MEQVLTLRRKAAHAGSDGPLYADFHALRHTYLTLGSKAGIDLRTLQELAGHSTPILTARYAHVRLHDMAGALERLPSFLLPASPETEGEGGRMRAPGTEGHIPQSHKRTSALPTY